MATIPMGNFGQRVAGAAPVQRTIQQDPVGDAVGRVGRAVQGAAFDYVQTQAQDAARADAEQRRMQEQERRRQEDAAEAAARGKEALALQQTQDALADLHDSIGEGIRTGTIPKDKAETEWSTQAGKLMSQAAEQFRPENRDLVSARLQGVAAKLGNGVRKAREQRDRQDVTASLDGILESAQREYGRDPQGARAMVQGALASLGPQSLYTPEVLARKGQAWLEGAQFNVAYQAVSAGRADRKALDAAEGMLKDLDALDPQKRAVLQDRIAGYRLHLDQQAEMRAARAAREAEARMRQAAAEFQTFQAMADKGTVLDPAYVDRVVAATAGTPYQAGIRQMVQASREVGGLAAQPVGTQRAQLDAIDALIAQQGRTPELDKRREQVEKVLRGSEADMRADPLRAGLARGVITDLQPLNLAAGFESVGQQLQARVQQANTVGAWAGRPVSPFTADEAAQMARMFQPLAPDQQAQSIAALTATMPAGQAAALAQQLDGQNRALGLALGVGNMRTTQARYTSELILRGAQALRDKGIKEEKGAEFGLQATIAKEVGDAVAGKPREDVIEAARLIYLGKRAAGENVTERGAVALALGGPIVEHNGRRVPVPAGMDADSLRTKLRSLPPDSIAQQAPDGQVVIPGGAAMPVADFLRLLPDAQLEAAGSGRYIVRSGGGLVLNSQRRPIVVDVR